MIRIVIAEDQGMLLGALRSLLSMEEDMEVVGLAKNGEEALMLVKEHQPDICVMDIEMPVKTGLDAAEEMHGSGLDCKVIILTTFARPGYFERARKASVRGYLLKDSPIEELVSAIRTIMDGKRIYAPELVDFVYEDDSENPLTERESQVLTLVAEGKTTKEIAAELFLSAGTVRNYISTILEKLNVGNRIEAIARFKEKGWNK
ncbi:DNA-binding response regulator [Lysinibacillus fusiformis]|jgi:two-component system response regulator DesR|uniref:Two component transcriptional regulator, LuxR family n=1 Tax=Lysinibacillus fusiformis TaxID=28031 RepID=A0A1H9RQS4_9BACI|nr:MULTISPECIES: response regulator transcription factor [Lysinibacillus]EAZ87891.1 two-component response regulator [Bacillus sp. B14905]AJK86273.1 transcriptional regulatory protein DesR [Lysinibacillus fusiformis]KAB0445291.1 DNA-binding response regulator [Lysinibacillus fusiformis]KEK11161.1 transcriptional regulatory protein DesR [Lysinibacillus sphaericus]KGA84449.1 transcriptional regulatory protein DesR [Lysinibacillus fusiformis]